MADLLEKYLEKAAEENRNYPVGKDGRRRRSAAAAQREVDALRSDIYSKPDGTIAGLGDLVNAVTAARMPLEGALSAISPEDQGYLTAMIPTGRNIKTFSRIMKFNRKLAEQTLSRAGRTPSQEMIDAYAFMMARYPKRMSKAPVYEFETPNAKGGYSIHTNDIVVDSKNHGAKLDEYASTLAHETQHAVDAKRMAQAKLNPGHFRSVGEGGSYRLPDDFAALGYRGGAPDRLYREQPIEKRAFKAGDTGAKSLRDYQELQKYLLENKMIDADDAYNFVSTKDPSVRKALADKFKTMMGFNALAVAKNPKQDAVENLRKAIRSEALDNYPDTSPKIEWNNPNNPFAGHSWRWNPPGHPKKRQKDALEAALNLFRTGE